jgi:hypothetical protein
MLQSSADSLRLAAESGADSVRVAAVKVAGEGREVLQRAASPRLPIQ